MRLRASLLGLVLAVIMGFGASAQEVYRLQANDRIELWNSVEPSLSRTATIGPDGWLSLPLVGHLKAADLTVQELERSLQDRLKPYFKETFDLTVMLQPAAPRIETVYVTGDVTTPGAYPYSPGMILLQAVSSAGGLRVGAAAASAEERMVSTKGEIARNSARLTALTIQIDRIKAEINGGDLVGQDGIDAASLASERQILAARRMEAEILKRAHDEAIALRTQRTAELRSQAQTLDRRLEITEHRLESVGKLVTQGYAHEAQALELESDLAGLKGDKHELEGMILASELDVSAERATFDTNLQQQRTLLEVELRDVQRDREAVRSQLEDQKKMLQILAAGSSAPLDVEARPLIFSIIRTVAGTPGEFEATELTRIEPGDLIRVGYGEFQAPEQRVSTSSIDNAPVADALPQ